MLLFICGLCELHVLEADASSCVEVLVETLTFVVDFGLVMASLKSPESYCTFVKYLVVVLTVMVFQGTESQTVNSGGSYRSLLAVLHHSLLYKLLCVRITAPQSRQEVQVHHLNNI